MFVKEIVFLATSGTLCFFFALNVMCCVKSLLITEFRLPIKKMLLVRVCAVSCALTFYSVIFMSRAQYADLPIGRFGSRYWKVTF